MPMLDWIRDYLDGLGIESQLAPGADETKANLYATIGGNGAENGGVALSGHTDVVPVAGQPWSSDPFELIERGRQALRPRHGGYEGLQSPSRSPWRRP